MHPCLDAATNLVDFGHGCSRTPAGDPVHVHDITDWPEGSRDGYVMSDVGNVINAYFVADMRAMAGLAAALNRSEDAARFAAQANATTAAMRTKMVDPKTGLFTDTVLGAKPHSAWHSQVFPLWAGVAEPAAQPGLLKFLVDKAVGVGVTGSVYAAYAYFLALYAADSDHGAAAYRMLTQCDKNSYCHMLLQGATATMEAWTRDEKDNLSWSHPWASAPGTAIPRGFFGINPTRPAFAEFEVKPQPGPVESASIVLPTQSGPIAASFVQRPGTAVFQLTLAPPANTHATVCLPKLGLAAATLVVDGKSLPGRIQGDYVCVPSIGSGPKPRVISRQ